MYGFDALRTLRIGKRTPIFAISVTFSFLRSFRGIFPPAATRHRSHRNHHRKRTMPRIWLKPSIIYASWDAVCSDGSLPIGSYYSLAPPFAGSWQNLGNGNWVSSSVLDSGGVPFKPRRGTLKLQWLGSFCVRVRSLSLWHSPDYRAGFAGALPKTSPANAAHPAPTARYLTAIFAKLPRGDDGRAHHHHCTVIIVYCRHARRMPRPTRFNRQSATLAALNQSQLGPPFWTHCTLYIIQ